MIGWLNELPVDLVELSGGSYEAPAMQGRTADGRTLAREAYFLSFAQDLTATAKMPLMTTGGIRRLAVARRVGQWRGGGGHGHRAGRRASTCRAVARRRSTGRAWASRGLESKVLAALASMALVKRRLRLLGAGQTPGGSLSPLWTLLVDQLRTRRLTQRYRAWLQARGAAA